MGKLRRETAEKVWALGVKSSRDGEGALAEYVTPVCTTALCALAEAPGEGEGERSFRLSLLAWALTGGHDVAVAAPGLYVQLLASLATAQLRGVGEDPVAKAAWALVPDVIRVALRKEDGGP
mmetsp:Transcript_41867/g.98117  ORF Transcript_41867/g.98117 Transcript_41867/m.98117 type:complete len:122 (-) Transcript_41867:364-729(-)